jgi:hypothetical protein
VEANKCLIGADYITGKGREITESKGTIQVKVKVKVKFTLEQVTKSQRGGRCIALQFL